MLTRHLPPVRRAAPWRNVKHERARAAFDRHFGNRSVQLCGSGTQALAVAIIDAARRRGLRCEFEVVLPAYGCPDLVAACVFARARPRLVDTARDAWGYDLEALRAAIGPSTAAIIAVNLFGVGDDVAPIRSLTTTSGVPVIQDSAQFFPSDPPREWPGDYVVLSFGRGKPINLLGGGALVGELSDSVGFASARAKPSLKRRLLSSAPAAAAFNLLTHPRVYSLTARLPGLSVGTTRYNALQRLESWDGAAAWGRVGAGMAAYADDTRRGDEAWGRAIEELQALGVKRLLPQTGHLWADRLLRVPLLLPDRAMRDKMIVALQSYGASAMYVHPLPQIADVPHDVRVQGPFPNAANLAKRLLTLPAHSYVNAADVAHVLETMSNVLARRVG